MNRLKTSLKTSVTGILWHHFLKCLESTTNISQLRLRNLLANLSSQERECIEYAIETVTSVRKEGRTKICIGDVNMKIKFIILIDVF